MVVNMSSSPGQQPRSFVGLCVGLIAYSQHIRACESMGRECSSCFGETYEMIDSLVGGMSGQK